MNKIMDVSLTNDAGEPVLFLQHTEAQKLLVTIQNISDQPVQLGEPVVSGGSRPAEHSFDLKLLFRPRTLVQPENIKLSKVSLVTRDSANNTLSVEDTANWFSFEDASKIPGNSILDQPIGAIISTAAGVQAFVKLAFARRQSLLLNRDEVLRFELSNVNPDVTDGTRVTRVETKFDIRSGVQNRPLRGSTLNQLNLVNLGKQAFEQALQVYALTAVKVGPLAAAFIGSHTVVNDGRSLNGLKIRVSINPDFLPGKINLRGNSSITLSFDTWTKQSPFGLVLEDDKGVGANNLEIAAVTADIQEIVGGEDSSGKSLAPVWKQGKGILAERVAGGDAIWQGSSLDFNLAVFTSAPSGFARLKIAWSNLSDFDDGELVLLAELGPTFVEEDNFPPKTAGLGTGSPLRFRGPKARIEMFKTSLVESVQASPSDAPKDFSRVAKKNADGTPATATPDVALRVADDGNGLRIETNQTHITGELRVDGNVGIGTPIPTTSLQVGNGVGGGKARIFSDSGGFGQLQIGNPKSADGDEASLSFVTGSTAFAIPTLTGHRWVIGNSSFGLSRRFVIGYGNGDSNFGPKLVIRRGGDVGIGTTVPTTKLQVGEGEGGGKVSIFSSDSDFGQLQIGTPRIGAGAEASICFMTGARVLGRNPATLNNGHMWMIGNSPFRLEGRFVIGCLDSATFGHRLVIQPTGNVGIGTETPEEKLHVNGNIRANGTTTSNRDMAENYYSDHDLAAGDVVCLDRDQDRIVMSEQANDDLVLGVISTKPGVLLNSDPDSQPPHSGWLAHPVALCGRVPCKVTDENGPIVRGDLLTSSSTPGHAMKALPIDMAGQLIYRQGTIIGKALAPFKSGKGVIEIFVCLR